MVAQLDEPRGAARAVSYVVLTPSRGLVHSRTVEAVLANVAAVPGFMGWLFTNDLPIPTAHETLMERGLATGADHLWFVEEDVIPPPDALAKSLALLDEGYGVAAVDYPVGNPSDEWGCAVRDAKGEVAWCGTGATLVPAALARELPRPWFSTEYEWISRNGMFGPWEKRKRAKTNAQSYGHQDIYFSMLVRESGSRIGLVPGMLAHHAYVVRTGSPGTNEGTHLIGIRDRITHQWPGEPVTQ